MLGLWFAVGQTNLSSEQLPIDSANTSPILSLGLSDEELTTCKIDRRTAFEQTAGPISISHDPTEHPVIPKLSSANATAWEQWLFDGTSDAADSGILINFTRDPSYHFFRQGNLRVELFLALDGRPVLRELDFVDESVVAMCPTYIAGVWTAPGRAYRFDIRTDMSEATVRWATARSKGGFSVQSLTPPFLAKGPLWPNTEASARLSASCAFAQPIAGGRMQAVHDDTSGRKAISGTGGHTRFWAADGWFTFASGFNQIRATAGPYVVSYWQHKSREALTADQTIQSAYLFKGGALLMKVAGDGSASVNEDNVSFKPDFGGSYFYITANMLWQWVLPGERIHQLHHVFINELVRLF